MAKAVAASDVLHLEPHDGREVLSTTVKITKAGDGLSKALNVEPAELHHGQTVFVVLECEVGRIAYDPVPDTQGLSRTHTLVTGAATLVDEELVSDLIEQQKRKIDASNGVFHLPFGVEGGPVKPEDMTDDEWEESGRADAELAAAEAAEQAGEG
jgi:hypothetical protein